ncbi:hypothetical protein H257_00950 [Aphanomyces astaci]|uniref:STAS domain-containing protein n=1 Tax=Aphanomyces astaci TaxID=112090 RepID=W4H5P0_APHAT|nr:hypothetical protein H257_00950 [Aphanomyces astaci]ETV87335.1 hypothetical protein H257_00950 [Aphanomyces astaci]|eukprot:XP_009822198.1 hypothetical protein H257_00950 [Aphanomyces astaci]
MHLFSKPSRSWVAHLAWLPQYNFRRDFKFDFIAGITVAMMIVPQEISLANIMHVPPQYGLYTAALTPVLYALFGSSRVLSVANGAEVSLMVGAALQNIKTDQERVAVGIFLSFYIGLINLTLGCLQLGVIADFFSRPVMGGFLSGGGVLIMISQLGSWFQLTLPSTSYPLETVVNLCRQIRDCNTNSVVVGAVSIVVLSVMKYAKQHWIPNPSLTQLFDEPLVVDVTAMSNQNDMNAALVQTPTEGAQHPTWGFSLDDQEYASLEPVPPMIKSNSTVKHKSRQVLFFVLRTICDLGPLVICLFGIVVGRAVGEKQIKVTGHVPKGFPSPKFPWYGYTGDIIKSVDFSDVTVNALSIALIVYMTSIAMAKRLALRDGYEVSPTNEFIGLGMASAIGSFFQVMPPTGGMSRTAVNMQSARTQLASVITVTLVILVLMVGTDSLYFLPKASLAAIIIVAGFWLIEMDEAKWLYRSKRDEFYVWLASFLATIGLGILAGLGASIVCSLVALMIKTKRPLVYALGRSGDLYVNAQENPDATTELDTIVMRVEGSLYFGNSEYAMQVILAQVVLQDKVRAIVIDATYIHDMDATTLQIMDTILLKLSPIKLAFANAQPHLAHVIKVSGLTDKLSVPEVTESIDHTIARLRALEVPGVAF